MSNNLYLLGLDIGTSGCKSILIDSAGNIVAVSMSEYQTFSPKVLWSEQNPEDWWVATVKSIQNLFAKLSIEPKHVIGIGLTGQMHGLVLLDKNAKVIRHCIMWNDQRTLKQCEFITNLIGIKNLLELTGNPVLPGFTLPKVIWVKENEPKVYEQISKILLPKDYIRYRLTGEFFSDVSDASGTSMFDVGKRIWSKQMLEEFDIPQIWLPTVTESQQISSKISKEASQYTGLIEGTPIVGGAGDQAAQAIGTGIIDEGIISVTIGTSGVVFASSNKYRIEPQGRLHAFCHAVPDKWHLMGVMLSAGGSLQWFKNKFASIKFNSSNLSGDEIYERLISEASQISAGSDGLLFLPYLTGERTPHPDPNAKGVFFGISPNHTFSHFTRSVLEGITFGLKDSLELMKNLEIEIKEVRASGGGSKSQFWRQLLADVFETEISTVNTTEGAAFGSALLAAVGVGVFPDIKSAVNSIIKITDRKLPSNDYHKYQKLYPLYKDLYSSLKNDFKSLTKILTES